MDSLLEKVHAIKSKEDFIRFLEYLIENLTNNSEEWANNSLLEYLEAMAGWTEDMDAYYYNNRLPIPENVDWKVFANILIAAKMYE